MSVLLRVENFYNHTTEFLTNNVSIIIPIFTFSSFCLDSTIYSCVVLLYSACSMHSFFPQNDMHNNAFMCGFSACSIYLTSFTMHANTLIHSRGKWKLVRLHQTRCQNSAQQNTVYNFKQGFVQIDLLHAVYEETMTNYGNRIFHLNLARKESVVKYKNIHFLCFTKYFVFDTICQYMALKKPRQILRHSQSSNK